MNQNYRETTVAGSEYVRCRAIVISNHSGKTPRVEFVEERITVLGDRSMSEPGVTLSVDFDPAAVINVLNPLDNTQTGQSVTYADVYAVLYSAWMQEAKLRDAAQPEQLGSGE